MASSSFSLDRRPLLILSLFILLPLTSRAGNDRRVTLCEGVVVNNEVAVDEVKKVTSFLVHNTAPSAYTHYTYIYGVSWCRHDLSLSFCSQCLSNAVHSIYITCGSNAAEARSLEDDLCSVRFAMKNFFGQVDTSFSRVWYDGGDEVSIGEAHRAAYRGTVSRLLIELRHQMFYETTKFSRLAFGFPLEKKRIYGMALCSGDLAAPSCGGCLNQVINVMETLCMNRTSCKVVNWSCFMKYHTK